MTGAQIWDQGTKEIRDAANTIKSERFIATAGQEVLTLLTFQYVLGAGSLLVFKNGEILAPVLEFTELSGTEVRLTQDAVEGDEYIVIGFIRVYDLEDNLDSMYSDLAAYWLGVQATDPIVDRIGRPLVVGAQYYNTTTGMKIWTGTAWVAAGVPLTDVLVKSQNLADLPDKAVARANLGVQRYVANVTFSAGSRSKRFIVANGAAVVGAKVSADVIAVVGTYRADELELESITVLGQVTTAGQVKLNVQSNFGKLLGTYTVAYSIQP